MSALIREHETPVNATQARELLGQPGQPWGNARISAIKHAMGIHVRYFFLSDVIRFLKDNPNFTERDIYPLKKHAVKTNGHHSNARAEELKWELMVSNWDLPWPKGSETKYSNTNCYLPGRDK